jgi:hypothetical protein
MFNAKRGVRSARVQIQFFDVFNVTEAWPGCKVVLKGFDLLRRTFDEALDTAVGKILHVSHYLMTRGGALGKKAVAYALDVATDNEAARDFAER